MAGSSSYPSEPGPRGIHPMSSSSSSGSSFGPLPPPLLELLVGRLTHLVQSHATTPAPAPATAAFSQTGLLLASLLHSLLLPVSPSAPKIALGADVSAGQFAPLPGLALLPSSSSSLLPRREGDATRWNHTGRYLYGRALLALGQARSALYLVEGAAASSGEPRLVELAMEACLALGLFNEATWFSERGREAEATASAQRADNPLGPSMPPPPESFSLVYLTDAKPSPTERRAERSVLEAKVHRGARRPDRAIEAYLNALAADPVCWDAFEGLCELGHSFKEVDIFPALASPLPTSTHTSEALAALASPPLASSSRASSTGRVGLASGPPEGSPTPAELLVIDNWIVDVLRCWGRATFLLGRYRCKEAIAELDQLPQTVTRGNVEYCLLIAKCYYEMVDYIKAKRAFITARALNPFELRSMDVYSTMLWHTDDKILLSALSHDLHGFTRTAREGWVALGNTFSLTKEHDEALRCFRRSYEIDPSYAYGHTLSGHEALAMEEFDRAVAFFRAAIRLDKRSYNAWYGLGTTYLRQNKYSLAQASFEWAIEFNPRSAVLLCSLGQVLEKRGRKEEARAAFERACEADPESSMARFRRAKSLASLGRYDIALPELQDLAIVAPNEFNVHFLLGKIYMRLGEPAKAMRPFAYALDIDPSMSTAIRAAQQPPQPAGSEDEANNSQATEAARV